MKPTKIAGLALDAFNAISQAHNDNADRLIGCGASVEESALASYIALRVHLARLEKLAQPILDTPAGKSVERIISIMDGQQNERGQYV